MPYVFQIHFIFLLGMHAGSPCMQAPFPHLVKLRSCDNISEQQKVDVNDVCVLSDLSINLLCDPHSLCSPSSDSGNQF